MFRLSVEVEETAAAVRRRWNRRPKAGVILGTGLGSLTEGIDVEASINYDDLPYFPQTTALSHAGRLICGKLGGVDVVVMEGRFHLYEGYSLDQITLPVRVMRELGAEMLVVSNASGGMNPYYHSGDIMLMEDHINMMWESPLLGHTDEGTPAERFPDMSSPYDRRLLQLAADVARREAIRVHQGVYVAMSGPNYETRAEYRFLRKIGGDVVGMSTVPEVIVARQCGLKVLALSTVTNICLPDDLGRVGKYDVVNAAKAAEPKLRRIVREVIREA
ncbi:purine-nucleoside phosphorylase [Blastopirellula sp. JC732]|uniref:Purine nucleoside phosphorylase n=1 Tax=Blastopirellula sediminis TaxID=2894196 RepID=A0A9X1MQ06_9BACT|nr:purine-nucleoside phosphorylase [Blastopirellula sediminis]MCC9606032.1 purine-nucleoside phosphorylase [Blastopirellula sediminis]MCC9630669.1 purine-nucleoside phosphorylase [Blastopirellula sediminis]